MRSDASTINPEDILNAAATLIEGGWCQGQYYVRETGEPTAYCAAGAIENAAFNLIKRAMDPRKDVAMNYLRGVVREHIPRWNDTKGRTQAEVISAIKAAARKASPPQTNGADDEKQ